MATKGMITYYFKKRIGKDWVSFSTEGENLFEAVMAAKKLSFDDVLSCGLCQSPDLELSAHETPDDNYKYVYIRCKHCRATLNFGQQKKDTNVFYLRTKEVDGVKYYDWQPYAPQQQR